MIYADRIAVFKAEEAAEEVIDSAISSMLDRCDGGDYAWCTLDTYLGVAESAAEGFTGCSWYAPLGMPTNWLHGPYRAI